MKQTKKKEYDGVLPEHEAHLGAFMQDIGYEFKNRALLHLALTHCSYNGKVGENNQRLEFLGDAVLEFVISEKLYAQSPAEEGYMTRMRANVVCEASLAQAARALKLGRLLQLGKGEEGSSGREKASILADTMEAVFGAVYLDGGMEPAKRFVLHFVDAAHLSLQDYKTLLQEIIQQNPGEKLSYVVTDESGPDHDKQFTMEVHLNSNVIGKGTGKSKKHAEQAAAKEALALMGYKDNI